ncbi:hypothetical protein EZJ43_09205 [Pedobacter changchengzhani]|uniref:SGNH/GDSL hydrolase family protein n=1 Tax=Pedobacter changchengzhani TaxID=2529274 RepID=A0A4V3A039_9SPHI|nr:hypothetical protein [Pedobacter changchengzhani]TDG36173.1 hypothetical protein EZJ43_09205 [Pedobacter changchengzhani]
MMKIKISILLGVALFFLVSCGKTDSGIVPQKPEVTTGNNNPVADPVDASGADYVPSNNIKVYIGGGDNATGAFLGYLGDTNGWPFVQQYADGYYINNFALNTDPLDATQNQRLTAMAGLFTNKNLFYETDEQRTDDASDEAKLAILKANGFKVNYAIINRGVVDSRLVALKTNGPITILGMGAPWQVNGDISSSTAGAIAWRDGIAKTDGSGIDGPLGLWIANTTNYREGSISGVKYAHKAGKIAMVMISPYQSNTPDALLSGSIDCVQKHEDAGASPDIWAVEYYAAQIKQYPVTPEKTTAGEPGQSLTGVAYYIIRHLNGKSKVALNTTLPNANIMANGSALTVKLPQNNGNVDFSIPLTISSNDDAWVDVCPLIMASADNDNYAISYVMNGVNITKGVLGKGFPCFNSFRLKGTSTNNLIIRVKSKAGVSANGLTNITLNLMSHAGLPTNKMSSLTIKCST